MNYTKSQHFFKSSNGADEISYYIYTPSEKPKALVQIVHGMNEYVGRYEHFIDYLCSQGYAVIANDHLGHGSSVSDEDDLGFFALDHGWIYLVKDIRKVQLIGKSLFGGIPHFFLSHSMGTLVTRCCIARYGYDTDGVIMLGTVTQFKATAPLIMLADAECALHGVKSRPANINKLLFGMSNARVEDKRTEFDWISRDEQVVADYVSDPKCNFIFTASAFRDLFFMESYCSSAAWYKKVNKYMPMLIMGGTDDPVGAYGRGVMWLYRGLKAHGFDDVEVKLWDGARHELHNEINRLEVYEEIAAWLECKVYDYIEE